MKPDERFCDDGVTPKIDPKKDYATIYGEGHPARYMQGGTYYQADGTPVGYVPVAQRKKETPRDAGGSART